MAKNNKWNATWFTICQVKAMYQISHENLQPWPKKGLAGLTDWRTGCNPKVPFAKVAGKRLIKSDACNRYHLNFSYFTGT